MRFKQQILETVASENLDIYTKILKELQVESDLNSLDMAAALAKMLHGEQPLFLEDRPEREFREDFSERGERSERGSRRERDERPSRDRSERTPREDRPSRERSERAPREKRTQDTGDMAMESYRIEVGRNDGVKPGNIVGAIANEADISSQFIHNIRINDDYSTVDLPAGMPTGLLKKLKAVWVCQRQLQITPLNEGGAPKAPASFKKTRDNDDAPRKPRAPRTAAPTGDKPARAKKKKAVSRD